MKFHNVTNLEGFFDAVNQCTAGNEVPEIEIIASNKEDIDRLLHFMITG